MLSADLRLLLYGLLETWSITLPGRRDPGAVAAEEGRVGAESGLWEARRAWADLEPSNLNPASESVISLSSSALTSPLPENISNPGASVSGCGLLLMILITCLLISEFVTRVRSGVTRACIKTNPSSLMSFMSVFFSNLNLFWRQRRRSTLFRVMARNEGSWRG